MSKRFAIVSIGTNSTRLLLADVEPEKPRIEVARSVGTRIGEGLGERGHLADEPMQRTLDAIGRYVREIRGHYVRLFAIATSALRRAENGEDFSHRVEELLGVPLRTISGEEEAKASYRGALTALGQLRGERVGVVDVGGGSSEFAAGTSTEPEATLSFEIGAVRLTESVPELNGSAGAVSEESIEKARTIARKGLEPLSGQAAVERLAFVGGSATTAAAIARGKATPVDSYEVSQADLQRILQRLATMTLEERKAVVGMKPQRADILPGGILLLETAMEILGVERAVATTHDLLLGVLLQERDSSAGQRQPAFAASGTRRGFRR